MNLLRVDAGAENDLVGWNIVTTVEIDGLFAIPSGKYGRYYYIQPILHFPARPSWKLVFVKSRILPGVNNLLLLLLVYYWT